MDKFLPPKKKLNAKSRTKIVSHINLIRPSRKEIQPFMNLGVHLAVNFSLIPAPLQKAQLQINPE